MNIKKILVSQPQPEAGKSPYFDIAEKFGVELVFRPFIKVEGLTAKEFRQQKINIADYTAVIFTAKTAVDNYFRLAQETRFKVPDTMKYVCTSESIANYLQKYIVYRKRKISFGLTGKLDDAQLLAALSKHNKEKYLIPVSEMHPDTFPELDAHKVNYKQAVMYRTVSNDFTPDEPFDYDMLIFFSPAGIKSLLKNFPDFDQDKQNVKIACFGVNTAQSIKDAGLHLDIEAPTPKYRSMPAALAAYLSDHAND
ncbi:MAG: uroporphyrinogen-III synthase [Lachnospiraceae bacterium]|nr:uroporphyrinogen-III synthase [Lachnospiraceae bacterium]